jgi:hypothetical protein
VISLIQSNLHLKQLVILTPKVDISEFPLQNFYRFVVSNHDQSQAIASFKSLPRQHTLTTRMDSPEAWNIQATHALQDIDNLICDSNICGDVHRNKNNINKDTTEITYTLKNLLVSGQCFQESTRSTPNGLQLILSPLSIGSNLTSTSDRGVTSGTLVMQNLGIELFTICLSIFLSIYLALTNISIYCLYVSIGYYQLQANPGIYKLDLAIGIYLSIYLYYLIVFSNM